MGTWYIKKVHIEIFGHAADGLACLEEKFCKSAEIKPLKAGCYQLIVQEFVNKNKYFRPTFRNSKIEKRRERSRDHGNPMLLFDVRRNNFCQNPDHISLRKVKKPVLCDVFMFRHNDPVATDQTYRYNHMRRPIQSSEGELDTNSLSETVGNLRLDQNSSQIVTSVSREGYQKPQGHQQQQKERDENQPKHADYVQIESRIQSYISHGWPHDHGTQDTNKLATAGFFFTGEYDLCRCYHCGIGFKDWTSEDDSLYVHLKFSPNCYHLTHYEDQSRIAYYRSLLQQTIGTNGQILVSPGEVNTIKHPEYEDYGARLESYTQWSREIRQTPAMLAEAGFFFTGTRDVVRCFTCDGGLQKWDLTDQPWIEHARWFPFCQYVRQVKGDEYIRLIQTAEIDQESDEDEDEFQTHEVYSREAQSVRDMGYSTAAVKFAIDECRRKNMYMTASNLINILLEKEERGENLPEDNEKSQLPEPRFNESTQEGLLAERDYLRNRLLCVGCRDQEANILFLPCGHHKMCKNCVVGVKECPLCKKAISQKVKTFMS